MSISYGRSTRAIHGEPRAGLDNEPVIAPIYQSTTFRNPLGVQGEILYSRYGNNPTQLDLDQRYALLEGAERATFLASGNAATAMAHLAVLRPGDHLVASRWIYGGTRAFYENGLQRYGVGITWVDPDHPRDWRKAITQQTRAIFVEAISNPLLRVIDFPLVAQIARERGVALLVDATFASPINFRPLEHGADIVITSASKYLNGHSDVIAGAVAGNATLIDEVCHLARNWGASIDPHAAWLCQRGLKTLSLRIRQHNTNAMAVAEWASSRPEFSAVHYPGLPSHPDHAVAKALLDGYGGMVSLVLKGGAAASHRFLSRLRLITHAPSLGGVESLVSEPRLTSHQGMTPEQREADGIPDGFLRLSCGCEDTPDLIRELEEAL